jgi:hypothetical protein
MSYQYIIYPELCPIAYVTSVTFPISRYGQYWHTIEFEGEPVTEQAAITAAEEYLCKPLTKSYFNTVKDDLGFDLEYNELGVAVRGELIEALCHLDSITPLGGPDDDDGAIQFNLGS